LKLGKEGAGVSSSFQSEEAFAQHTNLLDRKARSSLNPSDLNTTQIQADQWVTGFLDQATEWKSLAAMVAGGVAYRMGRISFLSAASRLSPSVQKIPLLLNAGSSFFGLGVEVTAFEATHRSLLSLTHEGKQNPNLWQWNGKGGFKEGWLHSLVTFGTLKGFGKFAEGQNLILQHGAQDFGMVLGHQLVFKAGLERNRKEAWANNSSMRRPPISNWEWEPPSSINSAGENSTPWIRAWISLSTPSNLN
jgi:hypothetical protein